MKYYGNFTRMTREYDIDDPNVDDTADHQDEYLITSGTTKRPILTVEFGKEGVRYVAENEMDMTYRG
jgi:hypothetical protein